MKTLAAALVGFMAAWTSMVSAAPPAFDEANRLFDRQQYQEAKIIYQKLIAEGTLSANLLCNLGDAEFRLAAPGQAALAYERALMLDPAHHEARTNLELVRAQSGAQMLAREAIDYLVPRWPRTIFSVAGAVGAWLVVFSLAALFIFRRRDSGLAWSMLLAGGALAAWCGVVLWRLEGHGRVAVTLESEIQARTTPADRGGLVQPLAPGSQVRVLSERGEWTYCELPGAQRGWLPSRSIAKLQPDPPAS